MDSLKQQVHQLVPGISALGFFSVGVHLIPTVGYLQYLNSIMSCTEVNTLYFTVDWYYFDLFNNPLPVPNHRKETSIMH